MTGADGFVGNTLCGLLKQKGQLVRRASRHAEPVALHGEVGEDRVIVGDIGSNTDWNKALTGVDVVVHLAARVHVMHESADDPLAEFRRVNVQGTERLARAAAVCGVKRLVYVSSIKVNGEQTEAGSTFVESDTPAPVDPYGVSKWEAEQCLWRVAAETGLEVVVVRPPLVYGPGVKGNFAQMLAVIGKGIPMPFATVHNRRSLVYVANLADALVNCVISQAAAGQTYLVSDGEDVSTSGLLHELAQGMGRPARLFACPPAVLRMLAGMLGKGPQADRLLGSLQVDSDKIRRQLNWVPPYTLQQGLRATADWYRNRHT